MITHLELRDSIIKAKKSLKKTSLKNSYEISKFALQEIISKWDENEAIANMYSRIKELEMENGYLMAEITEIIDVASKFIPKKSNNASLGEIKLIINNLKQRIISLEISDKKHKNIANAQYKILSDIVSDYKINVNIKDLISETLNKSNKN